MDMRYSLKQNWLALHTTIIRSRGKDWKEEGDRSAAGFLGNPFVHSSALKRHCRDFPYAAASRRNYERQENLQKSRKTFACFAGSG
jgi:hypothetical protein